MSKKFNKHGIHGLTRGNKKIQAWAGTEKDSMITLELQLVKIKRLNDLAARRVIAESEFKWVKIINESVASESLSNRMIQVLDNLLTKYKNR